MGCDIHAMIEKKSPHGAYPESTYHYWHNAGDPMIGRDYELFAVFAGVRNDHYGITPISGPRGVSDDACYEFQAWSEYFGVDGHSHSWLTLTELRSFDTDQEIEDTYQVLARNDTGGITMTGFGYGAQGVVGHRKVFSLWGTNHWNRLLRQMERVADEFDGDGDRVRLCFFFDN